MSVPPSKKAKVVFVASGEWEENAVREGIGYFERLAGASEVQVKPDKEGIPDNAVTTIIAGAEIYIPLEDLIDIEKEIERLEKERDNLQKELARVNGKLCNEGFMAKAPAKVIEEEREKQAKYLDMFNKVVERLDGLRK
jgi:valyl-tRNA synthetase